MAKEIQSHSLKLLNNFKLSYKQVLRNEIFCSACEKLSIFSRINTFSKTIEWWTFGNPLLFAANVLGLAAVLVFYNFQPELKPINNLQFKIITKS